MARRGGGADVPPPPAERVRQLLAYDPATGAFTWRTNRRAGARAGEPAGHVHRDGRRRIGIGGRLHRADKLAWLHVNGRWADVEPISGDRADNRIANLREAS